MAQNRYRALLLCKHDHAAHQFVFDLIPLSSARNTRCSFCFSMEGAVTAGKRKSLGWKDWQYFGQGTSHLLDTPGMCTHLNPGSKAGMKMTLPLCAYLCCFKAEVRTQLYFLPFLSILRKAFKPRIASLFKLCLANQYLVTEL